MFPSPSRPLTAAVLGAALGLFSACDSGGPEPSPDPGPQTANVTLDILSARAAGECDTDTNPGDYQIQVGALDAGNNVIASETLPLGPTEYGVYPGAGTDPSQYVLLNAGETATFDSNLTFQRTLDASGSFTAFVSATEWDRDGTIDDRMNDITETRSHAYTDGQFADIAGTKSIRVRGDAACDLTVQYRISIQ